MLLAEMEKYGEMIMESAWFESLKENLSNMHTYEHDRLKRMYSPVFVENKECKTKEFISFAMLKETEKHQIVFLMIEPFEDSETIRLFECRCKRLLHDRKKWRNSVSEC